MVGKDSKVADKVGFALAPDNGLGKRGNWLWAWSLAIPVGSTKVDAAREVHLLGDETSTTPNSSLRRRAGRSVPPGTRTSLYKNPDYLKAAPFAEMTLECDQLG